MKPHLAHGLCAAVLAAAAATCTPVAAQTTEPSGKLTHPPMQAYHNPDGTIRRFRNSVVTARPTPRCDIV